jgi:hypothetical protein
MHTHSVHAVARGSVEETPAAFVNDIATTKRQSHHCHLRLCTILSTLAQLLLLLHSQQPKFQVLAFARVYRSVELFCLLAGEHTHATGCRKSGDQAHMHVPWWKN